MMKIVSAYVDSGINVCTLKQMVYALNCNDGGYKCIVILIKHERIYINELIDENDDDTKRLKKLFWHKKSLSLPVITIE